MGITPQADQSPIVIADEQSTMISTNQKPIKYEPRQEIPIIICNESPTIADLHLELQQLQISCTTMQTYLISIDRRLKALTLEHGNIELNEDLKSLMAKLPLKTIEDIEAFDESMSNNQELKTTFIQYLKKIGGRDLKDNVNRCLPCVFTDELGTRCSYVGLRGNFKLQDLFFIKLLVEILVVQHRCTNHDVEKCVGEWFRLSNQRKGRKDKLKTAH